MSLIVVDNRRPSLVLWTSGTAWKRCALRFRYAIPSLPYGTLAAFHQSLGRLRLPS